MLQKVLFEINDYLQFMFRWIPGRSGIYLRYLFYRNRFRSMGARVYIPVGCIFRGEKNIIIKNRVGIGICNQLYAGIDKGSGLIEIGENTTTNSNVMINADIDGEIHIGKNVMIGPNTVFRASDHAYAKKYTPIRFQGHKSGHIIVEDDVWIGSNVSILKNVLIGKGAIVGAGAVVVEDVPPYTVVGGVPTKVIGERGTDKTDT